MKPRDLPTASPLPTLPAAPPAGVPLRLPVHPGRFLERQYLDPLGISQTRAAAMLGVSRRRVNELVMGHRAFSSDTALRCALAFGTSATFWLALQARWDCYHAWRALREQARQGGALPASVCGPGAETAESSRQATRQLRARQRAGRDAQQAEPCAVAG